MIEEMNNIPKEDDGSLAFLNIPRDENSRSFNCDETTQSKLVNTTFWVVDYVGYKFYRNQKLIRKSIKKNFCHTVSRLNRRTPLLDAKAYKQAVAPWLGWAKHSDSKHLLKTIIKPCYYDSIL